MIPNDDKAEILPDGNSRNQDNQVLSSTCLADSKIAGPEEGLDNSMVKLKGLEVSQSQTVIYKKE